MDAIKELADAHWKYVESVLEQHGAGIYEMELCEFHYKTAFIHGFKHGVEYAEESKNDE